MVYIRDEFSFATVPVDETWEPEILVDDPFAEEVSHDLPSPDDELDDFLMMVDDLEPQDHSITQAMEEDFLLRGPHPVTPPQHMERPTYQGDLPSMISPIMWDDDDHHAAIVSPTTVPDPNVVELQREYQETLMKLADSMRKSDATRQHIIHQRQMLGDNSVAMHEFSMGSRTQMWSFIQSHQQQPLRS